MQRAPPTFAPFAWRLLFHAAAASVGDASVVERPRIVLGGGSRSCKVVGPPALLTAQPTVEVVQDLAVEVPSADGPAD